VRYHRKGMPSLGPFAPLMRKDDAALLDRCAVLLRLAEGLERGRDQVVSDTRISIRKDGAVRLKVVASDEAPVARWAAARERELFERAIGRELVVA
jgi:exopolyphosphatase / guanosine-5'-triphosphate,3'-diphosphate pyrophosphatase